MLTATEMVETAPTRNINAHVVEMAEVLQSLYYPEECRCLVQLLEGSERREAAAGCEHAMSGRCEEAFLDSVQALFSAEASPRAQVSSVFDLRDELQVRVRFLDALLDQMRLAPKEEATRSFSDRAQLSAQLSSERTRYTAGYGLAISRTIREQLNGP